MIRNLEYPLVALLFFYILIVVMILIFLVVSVLCAASFYDFFTNHPLLNGYQECEHYLETEQRIDLYQACLEMNSKR